MSDGRRHVPAMLLLIVDLLLFIFVFLGLTLAGMRWVSRVDVVERAALSLGLGMIAVYLTVFGLYVAGLSLRWFALLPVLAWAGLLLKPGPVNRPWHEPELRRVFGRWLCLAGWCLGWQTLVVNYSGASWANDWVEHFDRVHFFLSRWPVDFLFLDMYALPARPPLANLCNAGLMSVAGGGFAHFQVFSTLSGSLVLFPLTVLLRRHGGSQRAGIHLLLLLMLSPLFVQNATFPWTKLSAAFYVLLAITQLTPAGSGDAGSRLRIGSIMLAGAMLAHYSAGPWIVGLGAAWAWGQRLTWREPGRPRQVLGAMLAGGLLLASWIAWSLMTFGPQATWEANNSPALVPDYTWSQSLANVAQNLWATVSPLAPPQESSGVARFRDHWFAFYQLKLPYAFGSAGAALLLWRLAHLRRTPEAEFWLIAVPVVLLAGIATHIRPDHLGLTHISLQPLVLIGLVWLLLGAATLPRWLRRLWQVGLAVDFLLGIGLHFALQSFWPLQLLRPDLAIGQLLETYTPAARANWASKSNLHLTFLADLMPPLLGPGLVLLTGLVALGLLRRNPPAAERTSAAARVSAKI